MSFPHKIFRAYDIRGVVDDALTPALVEQIGRALGEEARAHNDGGGGEVMVGRDGRLSGEELTAALVRGLRVGGCDVVDIGMVPTPVLYFAAARANGGSGHGVQVTASHNPAEYNGLKMMVGGETLFGARIQALKERVLAAGDAAAAALNGALRSADAVAVYREKLRADIRLARPLKVVLDCGNGVAGVLAPQVFRDIGCEVVELFCEVDGTFPNHHPDPGDAENLRDLTAAVRDFGADFGMAFDGDGDRLGVVSSDGAIIWPDRQMLLFVDAILRENAGAQIIYDVKCSRLLPRAIAAAGGVAVMCKTGHSFVKNKLRETGAVFAGEMSGHLFFAERWGGFDDAIYAGARLCELLAADARAPAEVFAGLPDSVNTPELRLDLDEGESEGLMAATVAAAEAEFGDAEVSLLDGVRVDFAGDCAGFGLIRASNTTPALIMRFEGDTAEDLARIQSRFREVLRGVCGGRELPF